MTFLPHSKPVALPCPRLLAVQFSGKIVLKLNTAESGVTRPTRVDGRRECHHTRTQCLRKQFILRSIYMYMYIFLLHEYYTSKKTFHALPCRACMHTCSNCRGRYLTRFFCLVLFGLVCSEGSSFLLWVSPNLGRGLLGGKETILFDLGPERHTLRRFRLNGTKKNRR